MTVARAPITEAIKQHLIDETGRPGDVGRAPKPTGVNTAPSMPYWILYPLDGDFVGPAQTGEADAAFAYQVTCVGERGDQLEKCADRIRAAFLRRDDDGHQDLPVGDEATLMLVESGAGGMDFEGPVGSIADRFLVHVTTS